MHGEPMVIPYPTGAAPLEVVGQLLAGDLGTMSVDLLISSDTDLEELELTMMHTEHISRPPNRYIPQDTSLCMIATPMFDPCCISVVAAISSKKHPGRGEEARPPDRMEVEWPALLPGSYHGRRDSASTCS